MERDNYHINYADLERFLQNLKTKDLNQLKSKIDQSFENIYDIISADKVSTTVDTLPEASEGTLDSLYVNDNGCYITYNKGTKEEPNYQWMKIGDQDEESLAKITTEDCSGNGDYIDVF